MALPDAILAFKLLDNAGLGQIDRHLALTVCSDLKFDTTMGALNRIFASKSQSDNDIVTVKEKSAFVGEHRFDRGRSSRRFGARNRIDKSFNQRNAQSEQTWDTFDTENEEIKSKESHTPLKFDDGQTVYSYQSVKLPATIGSLNCYIETEVVDCEIPLLLSKDSLKRAQTVLHLHNDKVTMFGKPVDVHFISNEILLDKNAKKNKPQEKRVTLNESLKTQNFVKNKAEHKVLYYDSDEEEDSHVNNQPDNESDNGAEEEHEFELESQAGDLELDSDNPVNNQGHASGEGSQSGGDSELENDNPTNQRH
ncbi:unnamed protein product [Mytilus coruscus]|uniref:Uncharacterized protein n=1 Tax=Mytilus coruscus TaxID=42192 RepID=A0A6J8BS29_MYTCO|nr:unnamed protein product [Mytilus coruscus]